MYSRGPYERRIELRESPFLRPFLKSLLLVASIGALGGGGFFLGRSHLIDSGIFSFGSDPLRQVAATGSYAAPQAQSDSAAGAVNSDDPITSAAKPQAPSPAPQGASDATARHAIYVPPQRGEVLGASTEAAPSSGSALDDSIAALKGIANQLADTVSSLRGQLTGTQPVIVSYSGPAPSTPVSTQTFAQGQKIDQLSGTSLSNITVNGVSGLTDADIPDAITASNYLPLSGGTLSGNLTMSGTLSAGALSVAAVSSGGAVEAPYFNATSTGATSTFAGAINLATTASNGAGAILSNGSLFIHAAGSFNFFAGSSAGTYPSPGRPMSESA